MLNVVAAVCDRHKSSGAHRAPLQNWKEFTNEDVYAHTRELEKLHPDNRSLWTANQALRRRSASRPSNPAETSPTVAGSGTGAMARVKVPGSSYT